MAKQPPASPMIEPFPDNFFDPAFPDSHTMRVTVDFDNTTLAIIDVIVFRSADCQWTKVFIGTGSDGSPNTSTRVIDCTNFSGTKTVPGSTLAKPPYNISTLTDFEKFQITVGT